MDDIKDIKKRIKDKRKNLYQKFLKIKINEDNKLYYFFTKVLILLILFLSLLIFTKNNPQNKLFLYEHVFNKNLSFGSINNFYHKYLGNVLPFKDLLFENKPVFKEHLTYKEENIYKDGVVLTVESNYLVPVQESGIVVFIGEKEDYGQTVIIQQVNGIDLWYGNIQNINVKIYDYVEQGQF